MHLPKSVRVLTSPNTVLFIIITTTTIIIKIYIGVKKQYVFMVSKLVVVGEPLVVKEKSDGIVSIAMSK